jgi:hypothetical protein
LFITHVLCSQGLKTQEGVRDVEPTAWPAGLKLELSWRWWKVRAERCRRCQLRAGTFTKCNSDVTGSKDTYSELEGTACIQWDTDVNVTYSNSWGVQSCGVSGRLRLYTSEDADVAVPCGHRL